MDNQNEDYFPAYIALWEYIVKKKLIKVDLVSEIENFIKKLNRNYENFGKAGIFVVQCTDSGRVYIGQDQNNILDLFQNTIDILFLKTKTSEHYELQEDADKYGRLSFLSLIDTDSSLIDKNNRKKAIKDVIDEHGFMNCFYLDDEDDFLFSDEEDSSSGDEEEESLDEENFSSLDKKDY